MESYNSQELVEESIGDHDCSSTSRSSSSSSSLYGYGSSEFDELQQLTARAVKVAARIEEHMLQMHHELSRELGLDPHVGRLLELQESHMNGAPPRNVDGASRIDSNFPLRLWKKGNVHIREHGHSPTKVQWYPIDNPTTAAKSRGVSAAELDALKTFDPCQNLRLRLNLLSTDRDFESSVKDKELGVVFKENLTGYIRDATLRFQGHLPLDELKEMGVSHARNCISKISHAKQSQKRRLLEHGASINECGPNGFIGGLEISLQKRIEEIDRGFAQQSSSKERRETHSLPRTQHFKSDKLNPGFESNRSSSRAPTHESHFGQGPVAPSGSLRQIAKQARAPMPPILRSRQSPGLAVQETHPTFVEALSRDHSIISDDIQRAPRYESHRAALLRWRELGGGFLDSRRVKESQIVRDLQSLVLQDLRPWRQWGQASKDILTAAWTPSGRNFAIGASANLDVSNLQYNERRNLLYGDIEENELVELDDHRVDRPRPETIASGSNSLQDTYNTLDPWLYTTVTGICFGQNAQPVMYTSSYDKTVKIWDISQAKPKCTQTLQHFNPIQLMDLSKNSKCLATSQDVQVDSITLFLVQNGKASPLGNLDSVRGRSRRLSPTSLRFGISKGSENLLLAGFSEVKNDMQDRDREGDLVLWDLSRTLPTPFKLYSTTRSVFDIAWHPLYVNFAAALPADGSAARRSRIQSCIRTWNPLETANRVHEFDCPALDVNELLYHPLKDNYISASCTDGATYLWDYRRPDDYVLKLQHGEPIDVIDPTLIEVLGCQRAKEESDTGVKLVTWDQDGKFLYTGSSDGVIKQWNPWIAEENAFLRDVASFDSGVMVGAFSPDHSHLLVGLAKGSMSILSSAPLAPRDNDKPRSDAVDRGELKGARERGLIVDDQAKREVEEMNFVSVEDDYESFGTSAAKELLSTGQIVLHPELGAGKGPFYQGPYAAWARTGAAQATLNTTELDPDVLANQIHPRQWQKGLKAGGKPTITAEKKQRWLQKRLRDRARQAAQAPKRSREHISTSPTVSPPHQPTKKVRPRGSNAATVEQSPTKPISTGTPTFRDFRCPAVLPALKTSGSTSQPRWAPSGTATNSLDRSFAGQTPSPTSTRSKNSPHSLNRRRPEFLNPREVLPASPASLRNEDRLPETRMNGRVYGNRESPSPLPNAKELARVQTRESAAHAHGKGQLIVLDDD